MVYLLRTFGGQAHEIWNVADPANPKLISRLPSGKDTHKNWWECETGIAYLVSGLESWRTRRMTEIYDLGDPAKPVKIWEFGLAGQHPGSTGAVPTELHGAISIGTEGNRVYFAHGTNKGGVLQIVDRERLAIGQGAAYLLAPSSCCTRSCPIRRVSASTYGLSNGFVSEDAPAPGLPPITQYEALQLNFKRTGDRFSTDSRDIDFVGPPSGFKQYVALPAVPRSVTYCMLSCLLKKERKSKRLQRKMLRHTIIT